MTASRAIFLVFFICVIAFVIWRWRRRARNRPVQIHQAHSPDTGYDRAAMARSAMQGHANGGEH
tara:strand:- start:802 stop:993 length:192 start_codon:yes stop_codon:yes gene_type:complete